MTVVGFPTKHSTCIDCGESIDANDLVRLQPTKRLDEINWDPTLGMPHGGVGDNGVREPESPVPSYNKWAETNDLARYKDKINPDHYKKGDVEVIQLTEKLGFCEGNIVKYVARYKDKGGKDDLLKARWYLDRLISHYDSTDHVDGYHGC